MKCLAVSLGAAKMRGFMINIVLCGLLIGSVCAFLPIKWYMSVLVSVCLSVVVMLLLASCTCYMTMVSADLGQGDFDKAKAISEVIR